MFWRLGRLCARAVFLLLKRGISILLGIRMHWSSYDCVPRIHSKGINAPAKTQCKTILIFCLIGILFNTILWIILRFYSFEARVKLICLDTEADIYGDELGKTLVSFRGWEYSTNISSSSPDVQEDENNGISNAINPWRLPQGESASLHPVNDSGTGFWIAHSSTSTTEKFNNHYRHSKRPSILLENFQFFYSQKIRIGIRFFLQGLSWLQVTLHSKNFESYRTLLRKRDASNETEWDADPSFCVEIIDPFQEHGRMYDSIEITAVSPVRDSAVYIDQIAIAVGSGERSLQMIHTMFPSGWCGNRVEQIGWNLNGENALRMD